MINKNRIQYSTSLDKTLIKQLKHYSINKGISANQIIESSLLNTFASDDIHFNLNELEVSIIYKCLMTTLDALELRKLIPSEQDNIEYLNINDIEYMKKLVYLFDYTAMF